MKRVLCALLAVALLAALGACGAEKKEPVTTPEDAATEEVTTERQTMEQKHYDPPVPPENPPKCIATPSYAVSDTYIYGVHTKHPKEGEDGKITLRRAPLSDIAKHKEIPLPKTYEGKTLEGLVIIGLTERDLLVSQWYSSGADEKYRETYITYRVALNNFEATVLDAGDYACTPWYNAGSDSLLFTTRKDEVLQIEAMRLNGKERTTIWSEPRDSFWLQNWRNTADGLVAVESGSDGIPSKQRGGEVHVVDKDNRAVLTDYAKLDFPADIINQPKNEAEQSLEDNELIVTYATCGTFIYYVEDDDPRDEDEWGRVYRTLYRMKADGTDKKLLREKTKIDSLMALDETLFCLAWRPWPEDYDDIEFPMGFYRLDAEGKVTETIAQGFDYDSLHFLEPLGRLILYKQWGIYGNNSGYLIFIYDPATGNKFSLGRDDS